ncbi:type II toxin-antitoxin system HicB family antitoxin [Halobellus salinisoli]|uniref:type II toxin-antitoxin system HicB family antitoxin n=1 Tax=Halobellus salinisoli TaxID=3108500 RepID=UPI00300AFA8A
MTTSTWDRDNHEDGIRLWQEVDWCIAKDVENSVTTQGSSRAAVLENLGDAVALHRETAGREPPDEELREMGIDPEENTTGDQTPPDVLK